MYHYIGLLIWDKLFPPKEKRVFYDDSKSTNPQKIDILEKVKKYEFSGGNIKNIVHYASLKAYERRSIKLLANNCGLATLPLAIYLDDVINGIRNEFIKEGKLPKIDLDILQ
jgi:hypothetical protein